MGRFIALLMVIIPIGTAAIGVKIMRDTVFNILNPPFPWLPLQFITGIILFVLGVGFIGGWIIYHDRKRNYNYKRLRELERQKRRERGQK